MKNKKETTIRIEGECSAILLNRYIAQVHYKRYNTKGSLKKNVVVEEKYLYPIQWQNIRYDIKRLFTNPFQIAPHIAYSLLAFFLILQGKFFEAHLTSFFFVGAIAHDANGQTSHSGEPATISWTHTVVSGTNGIITIFASGLSGTNAPTIDSNATTSINTVGNLRCAYYLNSSTGGRSCAVTGGNIKVGGSISFIGVDQTDPIGASTTEDGSSSPNDMSLTTEQNNSMRVDVLGSNRDDSTEPTGTLDSGTLRATDVVPQNQFRIGLFSYTNAQATAGSDTHQWTTSGFNRWYSAFELKESGGGGGGGDTMKDIIDAESGIVPFARA